MGERGGVSPDDGVIRQLTEALAHARGATQVLLQEVGEDLQHHLIRELLLEVLLRWRCRGHNCIIIIIINRYFALTDSYLKGACPV